MFSFSSFSKSRLFSAAAAILSCVGAGQAKAQVATPVPPPHKIQATAPPMTAPAFNFSAEPVGKYSLRVNTPAYKEYDAYTRWGARYSTDGTMTVEPFVSAQSAFSVSLKKRDGQDFFSNQKYEWNSSAATYLPVVPPALPNGNYSILMRRQAIGFASDVQNFIPNHLPPYAGVLFSPGLQISGLIPQWAEQADWQGQLAQATYETPPEWDVHTSTPTKRLFWSNGNQVENIPPTTVTVKVSDSQGIQPQVATGKVKINWHRPSQTIYDITILPVEWQIPPPEDQVGGQIGNDLYTELSDDNLTAQVGKEATVQAMLIVGGEAVGRTFRVVFSSRVGAAFVAHFFADAAVSAGVDATAIEAGKIGSNLGTLTSRATEIGQGGVAVETATSTQSVHLGVEPVGGEPATTRPLIPDGEPSTQLHAGDKSIEHIGEPEIQEPQDSTKPDTSSESSADNLGVDDAGPSDPFVDDPTKPNPRPSFGPIADAFLEKAGSRTHNMRDTLGGVYSRTNPRPAKTFGYMEVERPNGLNNDSFDIVSGSSNDSPPTPKNWGGNPFIEPDPGAAGNMSNWYPTEGKKMVRDMEAKGIRQLILLMIADKNYTGVARIFVDHPLWEGPCTSCQSVIKNYLESSYSKRVKLEIYYGHEHTLFVPK